MKKLLFLTAIAALTFNTSNAQEEVVVLVEETVVVDTPTGFSKSDLYVSGVVGFMSTKAPNEDAQSAYAISPSVGYFLSDNIALEAGLRFRDGNDSNTFGWGAGLGARYFVSAAKPFSFTVAASLNYFSQEAGVPNLKANAIGFKIAPGVNYFISDAFALRADVGSIDYGSKKTDADDSEASTEFNLNLNLSDIRLGLTYKF